MPKEFTNEQFERADQKTTAFLKDVAEVFKKHRMVIECSDSCCCSGQLVVEPMPLDFSFEEFTNATISEYDVAALAEAGNG